MILISSESAIRGHVGIYCFTCNERNKNTAGIILMDVLVLGSVYRLGVPESH